MPSRWYDVRSRGKLPVQSFPGPPCLGINKPMKKTLLFQMISSLATSLGSSVSRAEKTVTPIAQGSRDTLVSPHLLKQAERDINALTILTMFHKDPVENIRTTFSGEDRAPIPFLWALGPP